MVDAMSAFGAIPVDFKKGRLHGYHAGLLYILYIITFCR